MFQVRLEWHGPTDVFKHCSGCWEENEWCGVVAEECVPGPTGMPVTSSHSGGWASRGHGLRQLPPPPWLRSLTALRVSETCMTPALWDSSWQHNFSTLYWSGPQQRHLTLEGGQYLWPVSSDRHDSHYQAGFRPVAYNCFYSPISNLCMIFCLLPKKGNKRGDTHPCICKGTCRPAGLLHRQPTRQESTSGTKTAVSPPPRSLVLTALLLSSIFLSL